VKLPLNSKFSNCDLFNKIRHWLIELIAQDHVVILNAKITIMRGEYILFTDIDGLLIKDIDICARQNQTLKIEKIDNSKSNH